MKIHHKIISPFILLFAFLIVGSALVSISVFSRNIEKETRDRTFQIANAISKSGFVLDSGFLLSVKQVVQADFITYTKDGLVLTTTLSLNSAETAKILNKLTKGTEGGISINGDDYRYFSLKLNNPLMPAGSAVAVFISAEKLIKAKRELSERVAIYSVIAFLLVGALGYGISRTIVRPLQELVNGTKRVAEGDLNLSLSVISNDEVGILTRAFNEMIGRLKVSEEKLIEAEKHATIAYLSRSVAHEIRNPLSSIKLLVQLIGNKTSHDDKIRAQVQAILGEIDRLDLITGGFLNFGNPMELCKSLQDIHKIIEDVLFIMEAKLKHQKIDLKREYDANIPVMNVDADRLKQVIFNLVLNSMDAMPDGGSIQIKTLMEGTSIKIEVQDVGQGLLLNDSDDAFTPLVTTKKGGMGMGLPVSRNIIEAHGGSLRLISGAGGTTTIVGLPLKETV